jgi:putative copper resistance protein D
MSPAVAAFVDVLLRGLALCAQATAVGGVVFALWVLRGGRRQDPALEGLRRRALGLLALGGLALAGTQALLLVLHVSALADDGPWPLREVATTGYFRACVIRLLAGGALAVTALALRRPGAARPCVPSAPAVWAMVALSLVVVGASGWMSHAAGRLEQRDTLVALDAIHQIAAAVWLGGLVHLTVAAFRGGAEPWPGVVLARFSGVALAAVGVLVAAGAGLSMMYIDGIGGLLGTAYGVMVLTKIVLLTGLLALGALNFFAVQRLGAGRRVSLPRVRWFVEVEMGLGLTVLFAAASLTSLPPAMDVVADRASLGEIVHRFTPRWPTFTSPAVADMPVEDREAPRTDADRQWSEYNHHVAGLVVLTMGLLAMLHVIGGRRWARHWPLLFLGLAAFIVVRGDPGAWPLGPQGFWESMRYPEVVQHRLFALVVVLFGVFEWLVRTGRLRRRVFAYVFPLLSSVGGALLLTHSHALLDLKSEFLTEVTHVPIGVLALFVGWARWLELRLPPPDDALPRRIWATAFTLVGVLLLIYRES